MAKSIQFGPGTPNEAYGKYFTIPQMPVDREFLEAVDNKTRAEVFRRYGIMIDYVWQCNTVTACMIDTIIGQLDSLLDNAPKNGIGIEFFDLLRAIVSIKQNDKAEKEGNINIYFEPGQKAYQLIEDGPTEWKHENVISPIDYFITDDPTENEFIRNLDYHTKYVLQIKHAIMFPPNLQWPTIAIAYTFLENIFIEFLFRLSNMDPPEDEFDKRMITVNFNDLIEMHAELKNGTVAFRLNPGLDAKKGIKGDHHTEHTLGDDGLDVDI